MQTTWQTPLGVVVAQVFKCLKKALIQLHLAFDFEECLNYIFLITLNEKWVQKKAKNSFQVVPIYYSEINDKAYLFGTKIALTMELRNIPSEVLP